MAVIREEMVLADRFSATFNRSGDAAAVVQREHGGNGGPAAV